MKTLVRLTQNVRRFYYLVWMIVVFGVGVACTPEVDMRPAIQQDVEENEDDLRIFEERDYHNGDAIA